MLCKCSTNPLRVSRRFGTLPDIGSGMRITGGLCPAHATFFVELVEESVMRRSLIRSVCSLAVCGFFLLAALVSAEEKTVTTADGMFGADAYVQGGGSADNNYGTGTTIVLKDRPGSTTPNEYTRKGYVRFDLSRLGAMTPLAATLELKIANNDSGGGNPTPYNFTVNVYGLDDGDAGEGWGESTITWNNAPANDTGSTTNIFANAAHLGTFPVTSSDGDNTVVTFSNAALTAFISADTDELLTLILVRESASGSANLTFHSHNSGNTPPTLRIQTDSDYLNSDADAYVRSGTYSNNNYGTTTDLVIKNAGAGDYTRKGYARFDVSGVDIAAVGDAELLLDLAYNNAGGRQPDCPGSQPARHGADRQVRSHLQTGFPEYER